MFLGPTLLHEPEVSAESLHDVFGFVRGNPMAKATLVNAVLDAELRRRGESLASYLGAPSGERRLRRVGRHHADGR